jgi:hypothetical protein
MRRLRLNFEGAEERVFLGETFLWQMIWRRKISSPASPDRANTAVNLGSLAKAKAARISPRRTIEVKTRTSKMTRTEIVSAVQRELIGAEPESRLRPGLPV